MKGSHFGIPSLSQLAEKPDLEKGNNGGETERKCVAASLLPREFLPVKIQF